MAARKKPETRAQGGVASEHDHRSHTQALEADQFATLVRYARTAAGQNLQQLKEAAEINMKRLRMRRDRSKAVTATPAGSDQVDVRTWCDWMNKIKRRDRAAEVQLLALDATLATRG